MVKAKKEIIAEETTSKNVIVRPVPFEKISADFYEALDELRLEKKEHSDHKALIANAGAYMSKALRAIESVKAL